METQGGGRLSPGDSAGERTREHTREFPVVWKCTTVRACGAELQALLSQWGMVREWAGVPAGRTEAGEPWGGLDSIFRAVRSWQRIVERHVWLRRITLVLCVKGMEVGQDWRKGGQ